MHAACFNKITNLTRRSHTYARYKCCLILTTTRVCVCVCKKIKSLCFHETTTTHARSQYQLMRCCVTTYELCCEPWSLQQHNEQRCRELCCLSRVRKTQLQAVRTHPHAHTHIRTHIRPHYSSNTEDIPTCFTHSAWLKYMRITRKCVCMMPPPRAGDDKFTIEGTHSRLMSLQPQWLKMWFYGAGLK